METLNITAILKFKQYLQIKTVQPNPDYTGASIFLKEYAKELSLDYSCIQIVPGKPIHILSWKGSSNDLKSIMLNSHIDVVPVSTHLWTVDPFEAIEKDGKIYARGSQDMKSVGIAYLEAIRVLKSKQFVPKRTIHVTFVPDEEIGGHDGMELWVKTQHFKDLNVEFVLDEGLPNPSDAFKLYYGERAPWWIKIKTNGNAGHGSQFIEPNATLQLVKILNRFVVFRESEKMRLRTNKTLDGSHLTLGDVTSVNINMLKAGVQPNVVPDEAEATIDMRISPFMDQTELESLIHEWSEGASIEFIQQFKGNGLTPYKDSLWYSKIQSVATQKGIPLEPEIFPAATDSRYIRREGIHAFGLSPFRNTPVLLHDHDEYLGVDVFLEGRDFYVDLLQVLT